MRVKEKSEKAGLKLNIKKTKIMASDPITSSLLWQIKGEKVEAVTDFLFSGSRNHWMVTAAMNWKTVASWQENYDKPRQGLKSKDITLPTKVCIVKAMVFPEVMYGCESRTVKNAEH